MDILNWIYMKTFGLVKTTANDPKTDLIALGAYVGPQRRDDSYQTYSMPLADAVAAGCESNNALLTGIYDNGPFAIGYPVLTKTCTNVIDTPAFPTVAAVNLQGWKVSGSVEIDNGAAADAIYLGSVEYADNWYWPLMPWGLRGTVYTYDDNNGVDTYTALANGAFVFDQNAFSLIACNFRIEADYYPNGADLYLVYDQADPSAQIVYTTVSFEFEFLHDMSDEPVLIQY